MSIKVLIVVIVFGIVLGTLVVYLIEKYNSHDLMEPSEGYSEQRLKLPTDSPVYVINLNRQLKYDEWVSILDNGWELVTCDREKVEDYLYDYFPGSGKIERTVWHYVFKKC